MDFKKNIYDQLKLINLYDLSSDKPLAILIDYFCRALDLMLENANKIFDTIFIENQVGLKKYCNLMAIPMNKTVSEVKEIYKRRLAISNNDFTVEGIKKSLLTGGFLADIIEDFSTNTITVNAKEEIKLFYTKEQKEWYIKNCLPFFVNAIINIV
ncbi:MAG: hypothetical protein RSE93_01140 [Oscillospiraceae bacterium]